ncbi:sulfatase-like hydrolase/transferase, partial [Chloroflexota bacterium]
MSEQKISRRDFLKFLAITSLTGLGLQNFSVQTVNSTNHQKPDLPNIIIVVFDALSASHISTYGYHRETTPNLSKFAEKSTVFHRHYATGNFTMPGTSSLLSGAYPWEHGGYHLYGTIKDDFKNKNIFHLLSKSYFTSAFTRNPIARGLINQF